MSYQDTAETEDKKKKEAEEEYKKRIYSYEEKIRRYDRG